MYFDFEDNHPDISRLGHPLTWRDWVLLSIVIHFVAVIGILSIPPMDRRAFEDRIAQQLALQRQHERDATRFVFVQPHLDMPATRPLSPRADASDKDRNAQTRERAPNPTNSLAFSRGNTADRVEALKPAPPPPQRAQVQPQPSAPPQQPSTAQTQSSAEAGSPPPATSGSLVLPGPPPGNGRVPNAPATSGTGAGQGLMGSAMRDLQQYVRQDAFDNRGGGAGVFGPSIQFDTKGVEFGPWIRRFIAQIKRNWFIPYAAMAMKGHVVVTFYVMKDGTVQQLSVPGPCNVEAFNNAAYNAMAQSNPTYPLPPEYPSDRAFFTVTFFYNENPAGY
jgi:TonB family protein